MAVDPNEGASKQRAEELKQANIEGAKFKATMEGLNAVFKDFKKSSSDALKQDADLLGQLSTLSKGFGKAVSLSDKIKGFTVNDLKNAKQRNAFQTALNSAQGDQARVAADIAMLEETINSKVTQSNQALDSSKVLREEIGALAEKMSDREDYQLTQQEKIENIKKKINSLDLEKNGLAGKAAEEKEREIDALVEEEIKLEKILESSNKIFENQKARSNQLEEDAQNLETLSSEYKDQADFSKEILDTAKEYKKEIEGTIDAAEDLNKKVEAVNQAGNSLLKSFSEFGSKIGGMIPVFGGLFQTVFGELGEAQGLFEKAVAQGTSKAGARFKALSGTIQALTLAGLASFAKLAFEGAKNASEAFKIVKKGLGGGLISASMAMKSASGAASAMGIPLQEAAGYIGQMNDALGTSLGFSAKQVTTFGTLTRNMGVSGEAAAKLFKFAVKTGTSYEDMAANVAGTTEKLNAMNGTAVAPKAVFEEMGSASQTILRNMKSNPDALIKAAAGARAMGLEMNRIADAAESTLDFESSMAKEMEAELMLGKELNLDKLRAAAATGDQVTMQEEMKRLVMENKDALEGNVLAQGMMADTLGISKEELNKMLNTTEDQAKMAKQDAARKKANAENEKKTNRELGQQQLKTFRSINSLADRIAKFQEQLAAGAYAFFNQVKKAIKPILNMDFSKIMDTFKTDGIIAGVKETFKQLIPAAKESIKNLGSLVVDTFLESFKGGEGGLLSKGGILGKLLGAGVLTGGALTIGFKGLSAIGSVFKKMRGTRFLPMYVKNAGGGVNDLLGNKGRAGLFKQFKTLFKKPKLFFRALKMKGGMLGKIVGNIGSRLSNFKLPKIGNPFKNMKFGNPFKNLKFGNPFKNLRLPKLQSIFSKIKLPNLTKIFSKIKLPNLTNIFKNLKLPKMPKLPGMSKVGGLLSKLNPLKLLKGKGGAKAAGAAANVASKAAVKTGAKIAAKIGANALKAIPVVGQVAMIGMAAYDAFQGVKKTGEFFGKDQEDTTTGEKVSAGIGSALSGLTFGLLDAGKAARGIKAAGDFVADKAKAGWEGIKKGAAAFGGWVSSGWDSLKQGFSNVKDKATEIANTVKEKVGDFANAVKDKAVAAKDAILDFAGGVKDKALAFASSVGEGISNFASAAGEKISNFASSVGEGISNFASAAGEKISNFASSVGEGISNFANTARDRAKAFAGAIGEKIGNIRGKIGEFLEANDGLVGGIRAAASGIASRAKEMLGSAWKGIKNWVTGGDSDKSKNAAPEIKEAEIKKVTTPLVQMSSSQSKELVTALNASMAKGAESTVQAVNAFGDHLEPFITDSKESANAQLHELKQLTKEQNEQYKKQMIELQNQTAALFQIATKKDNIIKMDSFRVGKAITSRY